MNALTRCAFIVAVALVLPAVAYAGPLGGVVSFIDEINSELIIIGIALTVTGIIWAGFALTLGFGGVNKAMSCIGGGLVITFAPQIAEMLNRVHI